MGEYSETFTVDASANIVEKACLTWFTGLGFRSLKQKSNRIVFEKGTLKKNIYTFSFDEAFKRVSVSFVGDKEVPVTTVSVHFSLPFLKLKKEDISAIKSMIKALKERILITSGYEAINRE